MDSDVMIIPATVPETVIISSDDEDCQGDQGNRPLGLWKATKRKKEIEETVDLRRVKTEKHVTEATKSNEESSCFNSHLYHKLRRIIKSEKSESSSDKRKISAKGDQSTSTRYSEKTDRYSAKIKSLFDTSPERRHRRDSSSRQRVSHSDFLSSRDSETSKRHSLYQKRGLTSKNDNSDASDKDRASKRDGSTSPTNDKKKRKYSTENQTSTKCKTNDRRGESDKDLSKRVMSTDRCTSPTSDKKKRKYSTENQVSSRSRETRRENYKKKFEDAVSNDAIIKSEINDTIANDWSSILKNGLPDIVKEALLKNQTIPANCPLLKAPSLNLEILDHVTKRHHKKEMDKERMDKQNQLGLGITAVGKGLSLLADDHPNGDIVIKACRFIQQGCKILTDLHYSETNARKEALNLKPPMTAFLSCERDDTLLNRQVSNYLQSVRFSKGSQQTNSVSEDEHK